MTEDCYFCKTLSDKASTQRILELETDAFMVIWDGYPVTAGHALIIPKRHVQYMKDLNTTERTELIDQALRLKEYISTADLKAVYGGFASNTSSDKTLFYLNHALEILKKQEYRAPEAFNDGLNDGAAAGQTVPHFHWHVMPRWDSDMEDPRGGIRHMFPGMGNYRA